MSFIEEFWNSPTYALFSVKRATTSTGSRIDTQSTVSSGNKGIVRVPSVQSQTLTEDEWGKEYHLYCNPNIDIKEGDKITIETGSTSAYTGTYSVRGVGIQEDLVDDDSFIKIILYKK
ncbi:MAG TPA: hypothetical protein PLD76_00500 [Paludibacteraceae bacterium]|nr:hypothetical protein [Paludibacteraceae bacterium]